jgi:WD40 repeat protein
VPQPVATSFEPTGIRVAIASGAAPAAVVAEIDAPTEPLTLNGHFGPLIDIAWSPDGTSIATASADGSSRIFDAAGGTQRFALLGHGGAVSSVAWSPEGLRVATAGLDGSIKIWGLIEGDGRELFALSAHDTQRELAAISFSPDGNRLLSGDVASTSALVWHVGVERGAEVANLPGAGLHQGKARFSADDLVATGGNGTVVVWDASTWRPSPIGEPAAPHPLSVAPGVPLATPYDVERLSLDPTGQLAAVVRSEGGSVEIWDLDRGVKVATVPAAGAPAVAWSPSGERLAVGEWGPGTVRVVDRAGAEVARVEAPGLAVRSVAFASGGERLVATVEAPGEYDPDAARMVMWDWQTGAVVQTVATEAGFVVASDAGDLLAIAAHWRAESHAVEIRDASSGQLVATLAQTSEVNDLAFSADGSLVATGAADAVVRIWDARSGALLRSLRGHPAGVASVSFNDDASLLASYGVEGTIRVWALDVDDLVDVAHRRLTRGFTEDECRQFLHVASCAELEPTPSND